MIEQNNPIKVGVSRYSDTLEKYYITDGYTNYILDDDQVRLLNLRSKGTDYLYMFTLDEDKTIDFVVCVGGHLGEVLESFSKDLNETHEKAINSYQSLEPGKSWVELPVTEKLKWLDAAMSSRSTRNSVDFS